LISPVRARIIGLFEVREICSVRELAEALDLPMESLYYHIHALVRAGLLVREGQRAAKTRSEAVYRLLARQISVDWSNRTPEYLAALKKAVRLAHRFSERMMEEAIDRDTCRMGGPTAQAHVQQETVRLGKAKMRQLIGMLKEIDRFVIENNDPAAESTYVVTATVAPVLKG